MLSWSKLALIGSVAVLTPASVRLYVAHPALVTTGQMMLTALLPTLRKRLLCVTRHASRQDVDPRS